MFTKLKLHGEQGLSNQLQQTLRLPQLTCKWTQRRLDKDGILYLEHIGNSPEINTREGVSMPLRIEIIREWNAPHTIEWTNRAWRAKWEKFP
jgi:hypothetical protein